MEGPVVQPHSRSEEKAPNGAGPSVRQFRAQNVPPPRSDFAFQYPLSPVDIEIGAGNGFFAMNYAAANPNRFMVAIERTGKRFRRFENRLVRGEALPNLLPVWDNAILWICRNIQPQSVDRYFILYPNPYPKARQKNKRWPVMPFMGFLINTLRPGGRITFASNQPSYMEDVRLFLKSVWDLRQIEFVEYGEPRRGAPLTQFEKKYLERGHRCFRATFEKP